MAIAVNGIKSCAKCKKDKPVEQYHEASTKDGFASQCMECTHDRNKANGFAKPRQNDYKAALQKYKDGTLKFPEGQLFKCRQCRQEKSPEHFYLAYLVRGNLCCKSCHREYFNQWRAKDIHRARDIARKSAARPKTPEQLQKTKENRAKYRKKRDACPLKRKHKSLRHKYKIGLSDFMRIAELANGRCMVCLQADDNLCVDHNHNSMQVRGLLCRRCNTAIGYFRDDVGVLRRAAEYLMRNAGSEFLRNDQSRV